jgi:hypothetical protein
MSLDKLKRNLISCGKDFFIDNFQEIKKFHLNEISSDKVDELIAAKEKWNDISTIANRRSTVKILFDNNQILDALKITINSRAERKVKEKALEYFEIEANRPYDEKIDRIEVTENDEQTIDQSENLKTNNMNIPLNQIFYGPPGTGKTFKISSEAEKIINLSSSFANTREEKFNRICESVRNISDLGTKSNSIYRNERAILWMFGFLLEPPHDKNNSIEKNEAIKNGLDPSPSSWSQYSQYLTQFGFVKNTEKSTKITLNERGISLKNSLASFMKENDQSFEDLKNWSEDAPDIVRESYSSAISEMSREDFTDQMRTIYCVINLALNNKLRSETEYKKKNDEDRAEASKYIDIDENNADIKWIGQIGRTLRGLGIVNKYSKDNDVEKETYSLSDFGDKLINQIIQNWEIKYPEIFGDSLKYEDAILHGWIEFITFHQSYSYEEFIEGIRPSLDGENHLSYTLEKGVFKGISDRAKQDQENNYVIIIDEINRGNISKIFGELITLIEPSKRLFEDNDEHPKQVTLPYSKKRFGVPKNLYILGTMNTADKSIALLDSALRRRFEFVEMLPDSSILTEKKVKVEGIEIETLLDTINQRIEFLIDKDHAIGHSYFLKDSFKKNPTVKNLANIFKNEIIPLLQEYFYGDFAKIQLVLGDNKERKPNEVGFFKKKPSQQMALFGTSELDGYDDKEIYELSPIFKTNNKEELTKLFESVYKSN